MTYRAIALPYYAISANPNDPNCQLRIRTSF